MKNLKGLRWSEALLGVLCIVLVWRVFTMRAGLAKMARDRAAESALATARTSAAQQELKALWRVLAHSHLDESVELRGVSEKGPVSLRLATLKRPLLIFTFDQHCASCTINLPVLRKLTDRAPCSSEVVGISLNDSVPARWKSDSIGFQMIGATTGRAWDVLPLATPSRLVLIAPGGRVAGWWTGVFGVDQEADILREVTDLCVLPS